MIGYWFCSHISRFEKFSISWKIHQTTCFYYFLVLFIARIGPSSKSPGFTRHRTSEGDTKLSWTAAPEEGYEKLCGCSEFPDFPAQFFPGMRDDGGKYMEVSCWGTLGHVEAEETHTVAVAHTWHIFKKMFEKSLPRWLPHETLTVADDHVPLTEEPISPRSITAWNCFMVFKSVI